MEGDREAGGGWIGAAEAARRLGIKQASLYSYVSRGVLTRRKDTAGRASLFEAAEVERLARRGRPRGTVTASELIIRTELTQIAGDRLYYRGLDAIALAGQCSFEEVAALLWTGSMDDQAPGGRWQATGQAIEAGTAAQAALPAGTLPLERLQVIVPALAAADPLRLHLDPPAVITAARCLITGMVECLPRPVPAPVVPAPVVPAPVVPVPAVPVSADPAPVIPATAAQAGRGSGGIVGRLAPRLCAGPLSAGLTDALRAALVLLADHELAASTFAARVAASVRADPYAVVATGLGVLGAPLHGGASLGAEVMLAAAAGPADAARVVGDLLRRGERIPGFGHFVYQTGDPRAVVLLKILRQSAPGSPRLAVAEAVLAEARRRALPEPNIDFALAALATTAGMIRGAGEVIFAVARTTGWLAHALEEYARNVPIRPRAVYTGQAASR